MALAQSVWNQLRNCTADHLIRALKADGWEEDINRGATRAFRRLVDEQTVRRVVIHYHPKKTYGAKLLKGLIEDTGWNSDDLKRLKLIKK